MSVARAAAGHNSCASAGRVIVVRAALGWIWYRWRLDVAGQVGRGNYDVGGIAVGECDVVCRALCASSRLAVCVNGLGDDQSGVYSCFGWRAGTVCRLGTWTVVGGSWVVWRWVAGGDSVGLGGVAASVVIWYFRACMGRFCWADNFDLGRSGGHDGGVGGDGEVGAVVCCSCGSPNWRAAGDVIRDRLGAGGCASVSQGVGRSSCASAVCLGCDWGRWGGYWSIWRCCSSAATVRVWVVGVGAGRMWIAFSPVCV